MRGSSALGPLNQAVPSGSLLVAHQEGLFRKEGLDVELLKTAGSALVNPVDRPEAIFDRPLETRYNSGWMDSSERRRSKSAMSEPSRNGRRRLAGASSRTGTFNEPWISVAQEE